VQRILEQTGAVTSRVLLDLDGRNRVISVRIR